MGADTLVKGTRVQLMPLRNGLVHPRPPTTPDFTFYGGPVLANVRVIEVAWRGNVTFASQLGQFYGAIAQSEYFDLLGEYATASSSIGRGSFDALVTDTTAPTGTSVDDEVIQAELARLIHDGAVPANDASTLYAVHFPPGVTVTQAENISCLDFCAYHGSFRRNGDLVAYAVIPDMGGACAQSCGGADAFANTTWVASHEIVQAVTDPAIGFAPADPGMPLAWFDPMYGEIPDVCDGTAQISGYVVQTQWSAHDGKCRFGSSSTGSFVIGVSPPAQMVKAGTSATIVVTTAQTGPGAGTIALSVDGLPDGVTATFAPTSVAAGKSATLTLAADAMAPSAAEDITIVGTAPSGASPEVQSTSARLTVEGAKPANVFTMTATPVTGTVQRGSSVTFMLSSAVTSGTAESIVLGVGGLPAGVTATFSPPSMLAGSHSELLVSASGQAEAGSTLLSVTGTARSHTERASVSLDVAATPPTNDFALAVAPSATTVVAGGSGSFTVTTEVVTGQAQPIVLSLAGLPDGVTGSFEPPSVMAGGQAALTLSAAAGAALIADAPFAIIGTAASGTHSTNAAVTVTSAPPTDDFSVAVTPASRTFQAGTSTTFSVVTAVVSGAPGSVAFAISGLPTGVTAAFQPTTVAAGGTASLTVTAAADAAPGSATLSVTAASTTGNHVASAAITVTAAPPPDFSITVSPPSQTIASGSSTSYAITTQVTATPAQSVTLAVTGLPSGVHGSFDPATVTAGQSSTLTLSADSGVSAPATTFTVHGTSAGAAHTASASIAVTQPQVNSFSLAISPGSASVPAGATTSFSVTTAVTSGAAQTMTLAVTGLPAGATGMVQPPSVTAGQGATLTVTVLDSAAPGTTTFSVTGTGSSGTQTALADLTVTPSPLGNLIENGDFEDGLLDGWSVTRGNVTNVNINPHGGTRSMKVGRSSGVDSRSVVSQDVAIPATGTTTLSFWMYPRCEDTVNIHYVSIVSGGVFDDLIASCANGQAFVPKSFDISRYAGQTVTILFEADVDFFAVGSAWFYIDDVTLTNQP